MTDESENATPFQEEVLNEEFQCYTRVAKSLIATLVRPKDIEVSNELMKKCELLNRSPIIEVKKQANEFFKFFLKVLNWTSNNQPCDIYLNWYKSAASGATDAGTWLEENKSYMASKTLENGTVLVYIALSTDPGAGWQESGLRALNEATKEPEKDTST